MPIYEYYCKSCNRREERFLRMAQSSTVQVCKACDGDLVKVITIPPMVNPDLPGYTSPVTGAWIDGRKARREDLARTGCRPYEDGERQEAVRRRQKSDEALDAAVDETVERQWETLAPRQRELVEQELRAGVDITYERGTV